MAEQGHAEEGRLAEFFAHGDHLNALLLAAMRAGHLAAALAIGRVGLVVVAEALGLQGIVLPKRRSSRRASRGVPKPRRRPRSSIMGRPMW